MNSKIFTIVMSLAAVFALVSVAEAGWTENWDSYVDTVPGNGGATPVAPWVNFDPNGPTLHVDNRFSLSTPNALDGPADNSSINSIFRPIDPGDTTLRYSWSRLQGNTLPRTIEIGMYTAADPNSARVTMFLDLFQGTGPEAFYANPGGPTDPNAVGDFVTGITGPDFDQGPALWYDGFIKLLPGGTQVRAGWRTAGGAAYSTGDFALPAGFAFNYVGIEKRGRGGPNGPNARVDDIAVVPEPTSVALLGLGVLGLLGFDRRRRR